MKWHWLWATVLIGLCGCETTQPPPPRTSTSAEIEPAHLYVAAAPNGASDLWPASAPAIHARSAIMIDARTGRTLYQKFADTETQIASTQKLVTALVVLDSGNLGKIVTIERADTMVEPSKLGVRPGQTYTRQNLLTAMLVKSENDAAAALARDTAGSIPSFASLMNRKAHEVGAYHSHFVNPHGLPAPQYSTARDMAKIAYTAYREPLLRSIVCRPTYYFTFADGRTRLLENTNKLLMRSTVYNGMKTGYTDKAGRCLISSASANGRDIILVQFGSRTSYIFNDAEVLMQWGLHAPSGFGGYASN
jgi:serine-type D-Ala-D-Ala carboxypeptidase (penicillin-binding protein 5/6)